MSSFLLHLRKLLVDLQVRLGKLCPLPLLLPLLLCGNVGEEEVDGEGGEGRSGEGEDEHVLSV